MKRLLVLSVGLLASASIFGDNAPSVGMDMVPPVKPGPGLVAAPKLIAPAPIAILAVKEEPKEPVVVAPVVKPLEKRECKARAPYGDIASVMQDKGVLDFIRLGSSDIADKINQIGEIIRRAEKIDKDMCNFTDLGSTLWGRLQCAKAGQMVPETKGSSKLVKREVKCASAPVLCGGTKADCIKKTLQSLRAMLQMLFEDLFIGYKEGNTQVEGMALLLLNLGDSKAESLRNDLKAKVIPVLEKILSVLGAIEAIIPADK